MNPDFKVMMNVSKSRSLTQQETVALFSPSSPAEQKKLNNGLDILMSEGRGLCTSPPEWIRAGAKPGTLPYLAGEDWEQARLFEDVMSHGDKKFIWCTRGGYGASRWGPMVRWESLPVPGVEGPLVIGFSDVTFIHNCISRLGGISIHGPLITTLGTTSSASRNSLWQALSEGKFPSMSGREIAGGSAQGRLVGGNLSCLVASLATTLEPNLEGVILVLEDHNEAAYRIDRMLTQLIWSRRLEQVAGICIGDLEGPDKAQMEHVLHDRLGSLGIPVLSRLPIGHGWNNMPLALGTEYRMAGATLSPVSENTLPAHNGDIAPS